MTKEEEEYSCLHNNNHKYWKDCPLCIEYVKQTNIEHEKDIAFIDKCRTEMKELGFKKPSELLNYKYNQL